MYIGQSGAPIGFGNMILYGDLHDIPQSIGQRTPERWFNTDAGFEKNSGKQLASNIRAVSSRFTGVRTDGQNIFNLGAVENFQLREGLRVQLRVEAQNALNHAHFASTNADPTSTLFGTVTSSNGQPRLAFAAGTVIATPAATAPVGSLTIHETEPVNAWLRRTAQRKQTGTASKATRFVIALLPAKKLGGMRH